MAFYKIIISLIICKSTLSRELWAEEKLHKKLSENYEKSVRPLDGADLVYARKGF